MRFKPKSLRDLLRSAFRDHPNGSIAEIREACWRRVESNAELQRALFDYWFDLRRNDYTVVSGPSSVAVYASEQPRRATPAWAREASVEKIVEAVKVVVLMDFRLADGTPLRAATFGQCLREGSWLVDVGKLGHAHEVVGKKLTERDLESLFRRHTPQPATQVSRETPAHSPAS